jgi:hypothetical protein
MVYAWVASGEDEMPVHFRILEASKPLVQQTRERDRPAS